jgi:hypothetical protein
MARVAGSIRRMTIEGVSFDVAADGNLSDLMSEYENSMIPTSGLAMQKKTRRVPVIEGVVLITDGGSKDSLVNYSDGLDVLKFSIEYASGDIKKANGIINIESDESEENRTTISIHPESRPTRFNA